MLKVAVSIGLAFAFVGFLGRTAGAADEAVDASKILIKDKGPAKRQIQVQSKDGDVAKSAAGDPTSDGVTLHVFSATDDLCFALPAPGWQDKGSKFLYKDSDNNKAQIKDGKLKFKLKGPSPLGYTLDETSQGTVNVIITAGGQRWCMQCTTASKDEVGQYLAKDCLAPVTCPAEPPGCVGKLSFTTGVGTAYCGGSGLIPTASAPFSGEIDLDTAGTTKIADLGLSCLYFGGGNGTVYPPVKPPDGATSTFTVSGTSLSADAGTGPKDCTLGAGPGKQCVNNNALPSCTTDGDCGGAAGSCALAANCYLGPPLPIPCPSPFGALTACVVNVIQTDGSGTMDVTTGSASASLSLSSRVYITGNMAEPCPRCLSGSCNPAWQTNAAQPSPDSGNMCTAVGTLMTSLDCRPALGGFQAGLAIDLNPLTTGTTSMANAGGLFCPGQNNAGAFGQAAAQRIAETGSPAGDLSDNLPHTAHLGSVFCIPATGNGAIDGVGDLPGPGAISLTGNVQLQ